MKRSIVVSLAVLLLLAEATTAFSEEQKKNDNRPVYGNPAVKGKLVDKNGKAVPNARVLVVLYEGSVYRTKEQHTEWLRADAKGLFTYSPPTDRKPPSGIFLTAVADGYTYGSGFVRPNESGDVTITIWPQAKLRGKVVDEKGKPVAGATVSLENCHGRNPADPTRNVEFYRQPCFKELVGTTTTSKDGSFVLRGLPSPDDFSEGSIGINVTKKGRALVQQWIELKNVTNPLTLTQSPACTLQGTLYLPGRSGPAPEKTSLTMLLLNDGGIWRIRNCEVGKSGKFALMDLPPGKANLILQHQGWDYGPDGKPIEREWKWTMPAVIDIVLDPKKPVTLDLVTIPGVLIRGTVVDASTGKPISRAGIGVQHAGRPEGTSWESIRTDEKGEFTARVVPGDVNIMVYSYGEGENTVYYGSDDPPTVSLKVADGEERSGVVIKVSPTESRQAIWRAEKKPIPADFEITPGIYELTWDPDFDCRYCAMCRLVYKSDRAKALIAKLPNLVSERAQVGLYMLDGTADDELLAVATDESGGTGKGWDTAYIDANRNRDLTDDEPIKWTPKHTRYNSENYTPYIAIQSHQGPPGAERVSNPIKARLRIMEYNGEPWPWISLETKGAWKGLIDSSKGKVECAVPDCNTNGIYGDPYVIKEGPEIKDSGDSIYVDTNGFGHVVAGYSGPHAISLTDVSMCNGKLYQITTNRIGNQITVASYTGPTGMLTVKARDVQGFKTTLGKVSILGMTGFYEYDGRPGNDALSLQVSPPGDRPGKDTLSLQVSSPGDRPGKDTWTDKQAYSGQSLFVPPGRYRVWGVAAKIETTPKPTNIEGQLDAKVDVKTFEETTIEVGGPLSLAINPEKKEMAFKPSNSERINWIIKAGDKWTLSSVGDRDWQSGPRVKFFDRKGKLVHNTTAGYT